MHLHRIRQQLGPLPRQLNAPPVHQIVRQYLEIAAPCRHTAVRITRRVLDGAVVHLLRVRLELGGRRVVTGQPEIDQIRLCGARLALAEQHVGALEVGVHVRALVDVLQHVQLRRDTVKQCDFHMNFKKNTYHLQGQPVSGVRRQTFAVLQPAFGDVLAVARHHHEPMLDGVQLVRTVANEMRHSETGDAFRLAKFFNCKCTRKF